MERAEAQRVKKTGILSVSETEPEKEKIRKAASAILDGGVIGFPTETVYGLGADALNPAALELLYILKGREASQPTGVIIGSRDQLSFLTAGAGRKAELLMEKFWPGPLTIVLKASRAVSGILTAGTGTIAVRIPGSRICRSLLEECKRPITAPSANPKGLPPALSAGEVMKYFDGRLDIIIDGGESADEIPSTIIDATVDDISVIREGKISSEDIREILS